MFVLLLSLAALAPAAPAAADGGRRQAPSALIGCGSAGERVEVTASSHLDPSCTYTAGFDVTASNVTLDCRGATIRSSGGGRGIEIRTPVDVALHDVTVRRCRVEGFLNSLRVVRDGFRTLPDGVEFEHPTARISILDNHFSGSRGVGVYVDGYVSGVTIRGNEVREAGSSGIYLETGSKQSRVERNVIADNGYIENGPGGSPFSFQGLDLWFWGVGREGISVDGSYENVISGNLLTGNSAGGVFLYKNCGEYPDRDRYFERRDPADRNRIEGNWFVGGRNGVWIGSRMGENTLPMDCTDPAYVDQSLRRVVLDHAEDNLVRGNVFSEVTYGVRVEDDGNTVLGNLFTGSSPDHHAVIIGTPDRTEVLGRPVRGTTLLGNVSVIAGNPNPYRWIHGQERTLAWANRAVGGWVGLCEGRPVPRQPFVMVIAVAAALPGGGKPPTPDLTVPELGPLPAC